MFTLETWYDLRGSLLQQRGCRGAGELYALPCPLALPPGCPQHGGRLPGQSDDLGREAALALIIATARCLSGYII